MITNDDLAGMLGHWLATPGDGYLGGPYGGLNACRELLAGQRTANDVFQHMLVDVPAFEGRATGVRVESGKFAIDLVDGTTIKP